MKFAKSIIYINFENRKIFPLKKEYFNEIIEFIHSENLLDKGKVYLFLDEVQKIDGWEKYIRSGWGVAIFINKYVGGLRSILLLIKKIN